MIPPDSSGGVLGARFNLSEWALSHRQLVFYLIVVFALAGVFAYQKLGQSEDPPFTFKVMVVKTNWPGASARDVEQQVTDRIESKLQEMPLEWVRSYSKPGESLVFVSFKDSLPSASIPDLQYQVRKKIGDIRNTLPAGIQGPFFNDEFGDTYTNVYAITGDGFGYRDLKEFGDRVRAELLRVPGVAKVDFIGEQDEKIYVEMSNARLALLGIDPAQIVQTLFAQNAVAAAGVFETATDRIYLRPTGAFDSLDAVRDIAIRANNRLFRLGDIADISRGYVDPPQQKMRWHGREALGIGVTMVKGGDVIDLGRALDARLVPVEARLPAGVEIGHVASMPRAVARSVREFLRSLAEAVTIVLAVSLVSLGLRTGLVVAVSIPLVLAMTFVFMDVFDIGLHKISLGALILSLGLLVDDAIIAVEMMAIKLEQGFDRFRAASFAYTSTAYPMLTGTLVTVAGFLPIATAKSGTGEYTRSLFEVSAIALIASWLVAVIAIPYLGYRLLPDFTKPRRASLAARLCRAPPRPAGARAACGGGRRRRSRLRHALLSPLPRAGRLERRASLRRDRSDPRGVRCVDGGVPFRPAAVLPVVVAARADRRLAAARRQLVCGDARGGEEDGVDPRRRGRGRELCRLRRRRKPALLSAARPAAAAARTSRSSCSSRRPTRSASGCATVWCGSSTTTSRRCAAAFRGSRMVRPSGFPVQFRVSGEDLATVRAIAQRVIGVMRDDPAVTNAQFDSDEPTKVIRVVVDQNKARVLGLFVAGSRGVPQQLGVGAYGDVRARARQADRGRAARRGPRARAAHVPQGPRGTVRNGKAVSITQIADIRYEQEDGIVWRRDRLPTVTVRGDVRGDAQGPDVDEAHQSAPRRAPRCASARLSDRDRRRDRGFGARPEVDRRRRAADAAHGADAAR